MNSGTEFQFIKAYIEKLPELVRADVSHPFKLFPGRSHEQIAGLDDIAGASLPSDLANFYEFSYGAQLGEYRILTAEEVNEDRSQLAGIYGNEWNFDLIPFAKVTDTGDFLLLDSGLIEGEALAVLDGFHELPPGEWNVICYGMTSSLTYNLSKGS